MLGYFGSRESQVAPLAEYPATGEKTEAHLADNAVKLFGGALQKKNSRRQCNASSGHGSTNARGGGSGHCPSSGCRAVAVQCRLSATGAQAASHTRIRKTSGPIGQCVGSLEVVIGGVGVGIGEQANRRGLWKPIVGVREHAAETGDGTSDTKRICRTWRECAAEVGSGDI
ncbi:hypothetical protein NA56DRAFT_712045 [Hyaloscypha hepaticicola]|uniref:Uncharacterized protein n=1 Tax=Hyaloscypha hepaticicola TaxID=2082293 RepID=A0A2J6PHG9_9HELO|nr:hypothetical protein NA56DRAFT_712045 [Hyaloscypha hepaticicola]